jgi:hypothetical protein
VVEQIVMEQGLGVLRQSLWQIVIDGIAHVPVLTPVQLNHMVGV